MAVRVHILIHAVPGRAMEALEAVRKVPDVRTASGVTGPHDIIALVEAADVPQLGELVTNKIQQAPGVSSTLARVIVR